MNENNIKQWWDNLSDDLKFQSYLALKDANSSHANTLHIIVKRLLGNDYYTIASDVYGSNQEILESIKYKYSDVNYDWSHTWHKIKLVLKQYFSR